MQHDDWEYEMLSLSRMMARCDYVSAIEDAEERGFKKGCQKRIISMVLGVYDVGLPIEKIAEVADMSVNEVLTIIDQHKQQEKTSNA
jgi:predicted transposase/invertase (TIGR01784 family)